MEHLNLFKEAPATSKKLPIVFCKCGNCMNADGIDEKGYQIFICMKCSEMKHLKM